MYMLVIAIHLYWIGVSVKKVLRHLKEVLIVVPYLLLLIFIVFFLGVYRDLQQSYAENDKLKTQIEKTNDKLNYYIYRDSTSLGHSEGPEGYEAYKKSRGL